MSLPAAPEDGAARALAHIDAGARAILVLGGAGTGKTTFLHELRKSPRGRQVFLAPTGVAALQLGGQTLHSFFGIPPRILNPEDVKPRVQVRRLLKKLDRLVIDEISMVRADLLDTVDRTLRIARESNVPFGGVQVVLVGDFLQLPPVVPNVEQQVLEQMGYEGPFAFHARVLADHAVAHVPFTVVHRQSDSEFIRHLGAIRRGENLREALAALNEACVRPHRSGVLPVLLTPTNARADAYNQRGLAALAGNERVFEGALKGEFGLDGDRLPVPERLVLKTGARVMALRNDPARRWVNGSVGTVTGIGAHSALVRLDGGGTVEIEAFTWERIRYAFDDATGRIEGQVVGTFSQLPLVPAWAMTMHKAQGLTLEDVRIDFDNGAFAAGQSYVALSRARSLAGLSLVREIRPSDIRIDRRVAAFVRDFEAGSAAALPPA
ncbi:DEAD/DEAH box helicase [Azorhizobium sp. AG788]|uniref:ATP-dependent DNA helicase n=1 Tax=Azorhizobium sp. AG788 TaxID=2183897 RepID=UPI003139A31C